MCAEGSMAHMTAKGKFKECPAKGFVYVWEGPIRIVHWVNVFAILILVVTGLYIHDPVSTTAAGNPYLMGKMRFVHYLTGMIFASFILVRWWWAIVGNKYCSFKSIYNPFKKKDRDLILQYAKYYAFLEKKPQHTLTHNPLAQYAYIGIYVFFIYQVFSGFALWGQNDPNGTMFALFGWMFAIFDAQWMRWIHHFVIYLTAVFLMAHIYAAILVDFRTHSGDLSSIFSGWKADVT